LTNVGRYEEAHFHDIQNKIPTALEGVKVSIKVIMGWLASDTLFDKLIENLSEE
jgi:hypothetical protein